MALVAVSAGQQIQATQLDQIINLLTGVMTDQPVTINRARNASGELRLAGGNDVGATSYSTLMFGYSADATSYPHFLSTAHQAATAAGNRIQLWTSDGTAAGVFPTNAVLGLTIENGKIVVPGDIRSGGRIIAGADPGGGNNGDVIANRGGASPGTGVIYFGSSAGTRYLYFDSTKYLLNGGGLDIGGPFTGATTGAFSGDVTNSGGNFIVGANGKLQSNGGDLYLEANSASLIIFRPTRNSGTDQTIINTVGHWDYSNSLSVPPSHGGTMAPTSYGTLPVKIFEATPNGGGVDWTSIPAGFRHLEIVWSARGDTAAAYTECYMRFNGDTANDYTSNRGSIQGTNATLFASSANTSYIQNIFIPADTASSGSVGIGRMIIPNYSGTTYNKTVLADWNFDLLIMEHTFGIWTNNTGAINRITFAPLTGNFKNGTVVTLYGIP